MTVLMSFFGIIVFMFSCFTVGFKSAFKRLFLFIMAGACIDLIIICISIVVGVAIHY